ncbi:hypothetical protein HYH03_010390 [Edaphochlamys debaryana]|uniref:Nudix hydrolase domain-containing protein n=1 Tax=Edaphochlamys debaryana TaxID=47281 RepID=A0A835Y524_9CHLO|nr:hypothetical protein HYH03_010390 [Edaphochlamys debaryana]|eukprot:KAG2491179.1 hypothetical protein HYH03_010390 [Edaphochlamys debaryana]
MIVCLVLNAEEGMGAPHSPATAASLAVATDSQSAAPLGATAEAEAEAAAKGLASLALSNGGAHTGNGTGACQAAAEAEAEPAGKEANGGGAAGAQAQADGAGAPEPGAPAPRSALTQHMLGVSRAVRAACPHAFIVLWHPAAIEDPHLRIDAFSAGASMVSCFPAHLGEALGQLGGLGTSSPPAPSTSSTASDADPTAPAAPTPSDPTAIPCGAPAAPGACVCAWCGQSGLTADDLWLHQPLYHVYEVNRASPCCACGNRVDNLAVHVHEYHWPGGPRPEVRIPLGSAVIVHRRSDNKFLCVQEFADQGFWVPGGCSDPGEPLTRTALRECWEEVGVEVKLHGVVEVAYRLCPTTGRPTWRLMTFYATIPEGASAQPKTLPCFESAGACWVGADQLHTLPIRSPRIPETWFPHFARGGACPHPLAVPREYLAMFADVPF